MSDNFNRTLRDVYFVKLGQPPTVDLRLIPGDTLLPVRLALSLEGHPHLEHALVTPAQGAILEVGMNMGIAVEMYKRIVGLAHSMGWPLPKLDEGQS
jgi:hypothetical protein